MDGRINAEKIAVNEKIFAIQFKGEGTRIKFPQMTAAKNANPTMRNREEKDTCAHGA